MITIQKLLQSLANFDTINGVVNTAIDGYPKEVQSYEFWARYTNEDVSWDNNLGTV